MKRIAFFTSDISTTGGTQKVISILSKGFIKNLGYEVYIYSLNEKNKVRDFDFDKEIKFENLELGYSIKNFPSIIKKLNKLNKKNKITHILGIGCYLSLMLPFLKGVKTIACEHSSYNIASSKTKLLRNLAYRKVDTIISLTEEDKSKLIKINQNTEVIYNPIIYKEKVKNRRENVVITMGRLDKMKGVDRLIRVWSKIEKNVDYRLEIYGEGEEEKELKKLIAELKLENVELKGYTKDVDEVMSKSKIYAMTSHIEGLPMVLLEALSSGLPCISYDIETGPKEIIINGENGFLIENNKEDLYAEKLLELMTNLKLQKKLRDSSVKSIKKFDISEILVKWRKVLS